jgi:hypothetical protein
MKNMIFLFLLFSTLIFAQENLHQAVQLTQEGFRATESVGIILNANCTDGSQPIDNGTSKYQMLICEESKAPLFKTTNSHDILEMDIVANHKKINNPNFRSWDNVDSISSPAIISYKEDGKEIKVAAKLTPRGNSRFECDPRPLKVTFEDEEILNGFGDVNPLEAYQKLNDLRATTALTEGKKQKNNIFKGLGDDIKIVNPCAHPEGSWLGAKTKEDQDDKLLKEYTIYKMFETLNTSTLKTRLTKINYKNPDGSLNKSVYSFVREPEGKTAKRCGLENGQYQGVDENGNELNPIENESSAFTLDLLFQFIGGEDYNKDGHNVQLAHKNDRGQYYIGYDYDTSAFVTPFYMTSSEEESVISMKTNLERLLQNADKEMAKTQVAYFLSKKENMLEMIKTSPMNQNSKDQFIQKFDMQIGVLEEFMKKN